MPVYVNKTTGRLYVQFDYNRQTFKRTLPKGTTRSDAKKYEAKWRSDVFLRANDLAPPEDVLFERFVQEVYLPYAQTNTPASFEKADHICIASLPFFRGRSLRHIRKSDIEAFKSWRMALPTQHKRMRKPATIARELAIISKIFSLALDDHLIEYNPCSRVERPKFQNVQNTVLHRDDDAAFLKGFHPYQSALAKDVALFVLNTGLRQNDALGLSKFQVDLRAEILRLEQRKTKTIVEIPLNPTAIQILKRRALNRSELFFATKKGKQIKSIRKALAGACSRAKIPELGIRDLRRTFASRLAEDGVDAVTISLLLGHVDTRMVHRYARSNQAMRNAVNNIKIAVKPSQILPAIFGHPAK